jgi:hypothetical protein
MMGAYLICYLGAGNSLTLHSMVMAMSMGAALQEARTIKQESPTLGRLFVFRGYEVDEHEPS